jgi:hypothetical protein
MILLIFVEITFEAMISRSKRLNEGGVSGPKCVVTAGEYVSPLGGCVVCERYVSPVVMCVSVAFR